MRTFKEFWNNDEKPGKLRKLGIVVGLIFSIALVLPAFILGCMEIWARFHPHKRENTDGASCSGSDPTVLSLYTAATGGRLAPVDDLTIQSFDTGELHSQYSHALRTREYDTATQCARVCAQILKADLNKTPDEVNTMTLTEAKQAVVGHLLAGNDIKQLHAPSDYHLLHLLTPVTEQWHKSLLANMPETCPRSRLPLTPEELKVVKKAKKTQPS